LKSFCLYGPNTSQCVVTQVTATTSITTCFFIFNLASFSFRYFYSIFFKLLFTHFGHLDYGSPHSSTQRSGTSLSFPCLTIPPGYIRPNHVIYEVRRNSPRKKDGGYVIGVNVCVHAVLFGNTMDIETFTLCSIYPKTQTKIIYRLFIWTSLTV